MVNFYFGAYLPVVSLTTNWNDLTNWYSDPGIVCSCGDRFGTPAGAFPTSSDQVIIVSELRTGWSGGTWTGAISIDGPGILGAGTYSTGDILNSGTIDGGTFNSTVRNQAFISNGTFNGAVNPVASFTFWQISGGTFNGTLGTTGGAVNITGGTFNTALPTGWEQYKISGGTYDRNLVVGTNGVTIVFEFNAGLTTSRSITVNANKSNAEVTFNGGTYTGLITLNRSATTKLVVYGGSYSPPAVSTPAIKSGNFMTFSASAIPADLGFKAAGGTFNPTINLTGTSNEILGAGLL